jgi:transcriptional regulator of acetoin/glycerol metabolism
VSQAVSAETGPSLRDLLQEVVRRSLSAGLLWPEVCEEFEKLFILEALRLSDGSIQGAAELMGVHRNTISRKKADFDLGHGKAEGQGTD